MTEVSSKKSFRLNDEIVEFLMNSLDLFKASKIVQNCKNKEYCSRYLFSDCCHPDCSYCYVCHMFAPFQYDFKTCVLIHFIS